MRSVTFYNYLLEATLTGSLLILLLMLARAALGKRVKRTALYAAWLLVALRLLLPLSFPNPLMNELRPRLSDNYAARPIADQIRVRTIDAAYDASMALAGNDVTELNTNRLYQLGVSLEKGLLGSMLLVVYCGGALTTMGVLLARNLRFRRRIRKARVEMIPEEQLGDFAALCARWHIRRLPVWRVEELTASCVAGWLHPFVALPAHIQPESYGLALRHELAHLRLRDGWWNLLRCVCCVVHWFNPLVWIGASLSRLDGEIACDALTVAELSPAEKETYVRRMDAAVGKHSVPELGVQASGMSMKAGRVALRQRLLQGQEHTRRGTAAFAALAVAFTGFAFFTGEMEYSPSVEAAFTVMSAVVQPEERVQRRLIENQEAAEQWFRQLMQSDFIQAENSAAVTVEQQSGKWTCEAGGFSATFNGEGVITALRNATPLEATLKQVSSGIDIKGQETLYEYLRAFIKTCLPDVSIDQMAMIEEQSGSSGSFVVCEGGHSHCKRAYRFVIQLDPVVRVVSFSLLGSEDQALIRVSSLEGTAEEQAYSSPAPTGLITMAQARAIARDKVNRADGDTEIMSSNSRLNEERPDGPLWEVTYSVSGATCYEVEIDARNGEVLLFVDYVKRTVQNAAEQGMPSPDQLAKEDAIVLARQAIVQCYGFSEETVAGFLIAYTGIQYAGSMWNGSILPVDVWRISFRMPETDLAYISDYDVMLDAATGEILYVFDPSNNGNG